MFNVKNDKQPYIFDPFSHLGPSRRRLLDQSWAGIFKDQILPGLPVDELRKYYHETDGRPTNEMYSMVGLMILQQMHDLTDEQAVEQFAFNIKWHYALNITGNSDQVAYVSLKSLWSMRNLLTEKGLYTVLFDNTCKTLAKAFEVDFAKQRIDSVHIKSNMRHLGRISLFSRTIKKFLINLKRHHRAQFDKLDQDRFLRYTNKKEESLFAAVKPSETSHTLDRLAQDAFFLIEQSTAIEKISNMSSFKLLVRLFKEQCISEDDSDNDGEQIVTAKPNKDVKSDTLQNPSDPDAGYSGHKGKGFQTQVMETYSTNPDEKSLSLITHVKVEPANESDSNALLPAIIDAEEKDMSPDELLADSLYGSDDNVQQAEQKHNVKVVAPVMGARSKGLSLDDFLLGNDDKIVCCPQGNSPISVERPKDRFIAKFHCTDCQECHELKNCPVSEGKKAFTYYYDDKAVRLSTRRLKEDGTGFKDTYRYRAGVEATMSENDKRTRVKNLRVCGLKPVSFVAILKAIGINIFRVARVQIQ